MADTMNSQWLNPPADGRRFTVAIIVGLLLEFSALLLLLPIMAHKEIPSDTPSVVKLSIVAPAPKARAATAQTRPCPA